MSEPTRFSCPACGRFIGSTDGNYLDAVPCSCGWQTVVKRTAQRPPKTEADPKRERALVAASLN